MLRPQAVVLMVRVIHGVWALTIALLAAQGVWGQDVLRQNVGTIPFWMMWIPLAMFPNAVAMVFAFWGERIVLRLWGRSLGDGAIGRLRRSRKYIALLLAVSISAIIMNLALLSTYERIYQYLGGMFTGTGGA